MKSIQYPEDGDPISGESGHVLIDDCGGDPTYYPDEDAWTVGVRRLSGSVDYDIKIRWNDDKCRWEEP